MNQPTAVVLSLNVKRCALRGHAWYATRATAREFVPVRRACLRCGTEDALLPWGSCLGGHPIAEHYDATGHQIVHPSCPSPR